MVDRRLHFFLAENLKLGFVIDEAYAGIGSSCLAGIGGG